MVPSRLCHSTSCVSSMDIRFLMSRPIAVLEWWLQLRLGRVRIDECCRVMEEGGPAAHRVRLPERAPACCGLLRLPMCPASAAKESHLVRTHLLPVRLHGPPSRRLIRE